LTKRRDENVGNAVNTVSYAGEFPNYASPNNMKKRKVVQNNQRKTANLTWDSTAFKKVFLLSWLMTGITLL
jgi:hypothetical protein